MPKEKNSQSLESILGNLKKPKRPKAPPMPELEDSPKGFMVGFWWIGGCCRLYRLAVGDHHLLSTFSSCWSRNVSEGIQGGATQVCCRVLELPELMEKRHGNLQR